MAGINQGVFDEFTRILSGNSGSASIRSYYERNTKAFREFKRPEFLKFIETVERGREGRKIIEFIKTFKSNLTDRDVTRLIKSIAEFGEIRYMIQAVEDLRFLRSDDKKILFKAIVRRGKRDDLNHLKNHVNLSKEDYTVITKEVVATGDLDFIVGFAIDHASNLSSDHFDDLVKRVVENDNADHIKQMLKISQLSDKNRDALNEKLIQLGKADEYAEKVDKLNEGPSLSFAESLKSSGDAYGLSVMLTENADLSDKIVTTALDGLMKIGNSRSIVGIIDSPYVSDGVRNNLIDKVIEKKEWTIIARLIINLTNASLALERITDLVRLVIESSNVKAMKLLFEKSDKLPQENRDQLAEALTNIENKEEMLKDVAQEDNKILPSPEETLAKAIEERDVALLKAMIQNGAYFTPEEIEMINNSTILTPADKQEISEYLIHADMKYENDLKEQKIFDDSRESLMDIFAYGEFLDHNIELEGNAEELEKLFLYVQSKNNDELMLEFLGNLDNADQITIIQEELNRIWRENGTLFEEMMPEEYVVQMRQKGQPFVRQLEDTPQTKKED